MLKQLVGRLLDRVVVVLRGTLLRSEEPAADHALEVAEGEAVAGEGSAVAAPRLSAVPLHRSWIVDASSLLV